MRVLGLLVLLVVLGGLVASGMAHGWTPVGVEVGLVLAFLAVVVAMPTKKPARQPVGSRSR